MGLPQADVQAFQNLIDPFTVVESSFTVVESSGGGSASTSSHLDGGIAGVVLASLGVAGLSTALVIRMHTLKQRQAHEDRRIELLTSMEADADAMML